MMRRLTREGSLVFIFIALICNAARGQFLQFLQPIGVPQLQALTTNVDGTGIQIGQAEAPLDGDVVWQVDPTNIPVATNLFTYIYSNGITSTGYPNALGSVSWHADLVAQNIYGPASGIATNVPHVDNYDANNYVLENDQGDIYLPYYNTNDRVINQSFAFLIVSNNDDLIHEPSNLCVAIDLAFDNAAAKYGTLFVSGAGNGSPAPVNPPASSYNGIGVGVYGANTSAGPTIDYGRCQPQLTASATNGDTSFSTGYVTGAAAALMQAALRGDGGGDTNSAVNMITIKTLLLNGAVKPSDWANVPPSPLDYTYGSGYLNVFNSYEQLAGGKHSYDFATNIPTGTVHPPVAMSLSVPVLNGWDFNTNTSSSSDDGVNHYFFNITNGVNGAAFSMTATLVWNKHYNKTTINNLELFLYNAANSNLVAASTSVVDNVQQVFVPQLAQGRYDLQVWKAGGSYVTANESYGLAWEIYSDSLTMEQCGTNVCLTWPAYPAGFQVMATSTLTPPVLWFANTLPSPVYTNNLNVIWITPGNSAEYFRLQSPDF